MGREYKIDVNKTELTLAASGVGYTPTLQLSGVQGFMSIMATISGSGTITAEYEVSNTEDSPEVWVSPDGAAAIFTDKAAGSHFFPIELPVLALKMRVKFTETGGANTATVVSRIAIQ